MQRLNGVTVRTVGSEPWRGSLSDRILIAENRCAAFFVSTMSPARSRRWIADLHRCRTSVSAQLRLNPLSASRNWRADGDGCDGLHLMQVWRRRAQGCDGLHGWKRARVRSLSDRILIAENRCAAFFVSTMSPDSETAALQCGRPVSIVPRFTRPDTWTRPPVSHVESDRR